MQTIQNGRGRRPVLDRREFLRLAALTTPALLAFRRAAAQGAAPDAVVQTPNGALRGSVESGIRVFRGVPFAQPPVGPLRYRPPVKLAPWHGTRDALQFASAAFQPKKPRLPQSEDCLYLNVWAPAGPGPYQVFVWIHGGGFTNGTSFDAVQNGANFADAGIVCVTVAYRLGVFGFLDMAPLLGGQYAGSADNGLRDVIESLRWVQANIAAFGGDPGRVTIGGESAGAKLTDILMGVPEARGLFQSMISESGGAERIWPESDAGSVAAGFADTWKATGNTVAALTTASPEDLVSAQKQFIQAWPKHFPLRCELDAALVPAMPVAAIASGSTRGKRLLLGTNLDESALFVGPHPEEITARDLGNLPLNRFEAVFAQYRQLYPQLTEAQLRIRALTAEEYWIPSMRVLEAHLQGGGMAWAYRLDYAPKDGPLHGFAYHSEDVRLVWDDAKGGHDDAADEDLLEAQMHAAWVAFIRGEAPAAQGLPPWPQYDVPAGATMLLNMQSRVENAPAAQELRLWDGVL